MFDEGALLCRYLALLERVRGDGIIVIEGSSCVVTLAFASSGCTKGVKLSCKLSLGLDKGPTVITHRLVACVGVLSEQCESGRNKHHEKQDEGKGGVVDEEYDSHDSSHDSLSHD
jgi:hypothetical protein